MEHVSNTAANMNRAATHSGRPLPEGSAGVESDRSPNTFTDSAKQQTAAASRQATALLQDTAKQFHATANSVVDRAASDLGQQLSITVGAIRESLIPLTERQPKIAALADQSVVKLENAAASVGRKDLDNLTKNAGDLAREKPALFIGGALLAGLAAGRFIQLAIESE